MPKKDLEDFVKRRPPIFWWFLANLVAISLAVASWIVCLNLFRDPTHPTSYQLMLKVGRIQPLVNFTPTTAPRPKKTSDPLTLEAEFQRFSDDDLIVINQELKRAYLTNYQNNQFLTYVTGEFKVMEVIPLQEKHFLQGGAAVKAQAIVRPDDLADPIPYPIFIEFLMPGESSLTELYQPGDTLVLKKIPDCAAVLRVGKVDYETNAALYFTLVPLCGADPRISPPEAAHVAASLPVFK